MNFLSLLDRKALGISSKPIKILCYLLTPYIRALLITWCISKAFLFQIVFLAFMDCNICDLIQCVCPNFYFIPSWLLSLLWLINRAPKLISDLGFLINFYQFAWCFVDLVSLPVTLSHCHPWPQDSRLFTNNKFTLCNFSTLKSQ